MVRSIKHEFKSGSDPQLSLIQVYRGFAALLVVLHHSSDMVQAYFGGTTNLLLQFFAFGKAGLQFFFVLSGFIIYYIHRGDIGTPAKLLPYAKKRLIRIYPVYIFVTLLLVPFWLLVPSFGQPYHKSLSALILSLLLFPQAHLPHLEVAWTLIHEVIFYTLFACLIWSVRFGAAVLAAWFASIALVNLASDTPLSFQATYFLSINNLLFGMGIGAAYIAAKLRPASGLGIGLFVLGNVGFLAVGLVANGLGDPTPGQQATLILALGVTTFLIVGQANNSLLDQAAARRPVLRLLGDASYSIYLIHDPALSLCSKAIRQTAMSVPPSLAFLLTSLFATLCGVALHLYIERPTLKLLRTWLLPRPTTTLAAC